MAAPGRTAAAAEPHQFQRVSSAPLAFAWRAFASEAECEALVAHAAAARAFAVGEDAAVVYSVEGFSRVVQMNDKMYAWVDHGERGGLSAAAQALVDRFDGASAAFLGVASAEEQQQPWQSVVNLTPQCAGAPGLLNGLHVDTYNDEPRRFATSLLYLRTVERGGETLFASDPAGAALLDARVESTLDATTGRARLVSDLEASSRPLVPPEQGTLLLFFVRGADGVIDPAAFHGSARPLSGDKWTLQTFWAVPDRFEDVDGYARACFEGVSWHGA